MAGEHSHFIERKHFSRAVIYTAHSDNLYHPWIQCPFLSDPNKTQSEGER